MRNKIIILLFLLLSLPFCGKGKGKGKIESLADMASKVTIGEYYVVSGMYVDYKGNVYIPNTSKTSIDKYSPEGKFLLSFGRKGEGPGEFRYVPFFAVDTRGFVYAIDIDWNVSQFDSSGKFLKNYRLPWNLKGTPFMPRFSPLNQLVVSTSFFTSKDIRNAQHYIKVYLLPENGEPLLLLNDDSRSNIVSLYPLRGFLNFCPHYDFDSQGNIYVSDPVFYKVHVFNPAGKKIREFTRKCEREKISEGDLEVSNPKIKEEIGNLIAMAKKDISKLPGNSKYFPCIFNINVDKDRVYLWRPTRINGKFLVDIYTTDFQFLGQRSFYNTTGNINTDTTFIRNGFLYILDIIPEDPRHLNGRLLLPKIPSAVLKFRVIPM